MGTFTLGLDGVGVRVDVIVIVGVSLLRCRKLLNSPLGLDGVVMRFGASCTLGGARFCPGLLRYWSRFISVSGSGVGTLGGALLCCSRSMQSALFSSGIVGTCSSAVSVVAVQ